MMKLNKSNVATIERDMISIFNYYPPELIEASLLPLLAKENDYCINEPMNITHVFYAELNEVIQRSLLIYQQEKFKVKTASSAKYARNIGEIIQILIAIIPVSYIFCKDPNHKFANLHIVLKQYEYKPFDEIEKAVIFSLLPYPKITCTVHAYGTTTDLIGKGHFYFSNLCVLANCIYQNDNEFKLPLPNAQLLATKKLNSIQVFTKNFTKAISFLDGAKVFQKKNENNMAAFMLQQTCEFAYRSLIMAFKGKDIKSHDLIVLRNQISIYEPQIFDLTKLSHKKEINLLQTLNESYVKARYDFSYQISTSQLLVITNAIENILEGVAHLFEIYTFSK